MWNEPQVICDHPSFTCTKYHNQCSPCIPYEVGEGLYMRGPYYLLSQVEGYMGLQVRGDNERSYFLNDLI